MLTIYHLFVGLVNIFFRWISCCVLLLAGNIVLELSKDKNNASLLDRQLVQFQSSVNRVEGELSGQIRYLTQVNYTAPLYHKFDHWTEHECLMVQVMKHDLMEFITV